MRELLPSRAGTRWSAGICRKLSALWLRQKGRANAKPAEADHGPVVRVCRASSLDIQDDPVVCLRVSLFAFAQVRSGD